MSRARRIMVSAVAVAVAAFGAMAATGGAGAAPNNGEGLVFVVLAVAISCIGGVFAFTKRRSSDAV